MHKRIGLWVQLAIVLALGWGAMLIGKLCSSDPSSGYFAALMALVFFAIVNTVVSIAYKSFLRYTVPSYYVYVILAVILLQSAKLSSGISIWKLDEYRMMLVSVSVFYLIASLLVRVIRVIYDAVESGF